MTEPKFENGIWFCPICNFKAMSKKVVEMHIQREHGGEASSQPSKSNQVDAKKPSPHEQKPPKNEKPHSGKEKGEQAKKRHKKTARDWQRELYHNYVFELLHNKKAEIELKDGRILRGKIHARDPYAILIDLDDGGRLIINKGHIAVYKPLEG